jgi:magnesium transporter
MSQLPTAEQSQQAIATADSPATRFRELPGHRRRALFFQLPDKIQQTVVDDMSREQLEEFVGRLDPDEAADVLGLVGGEVRDEIVSHLSRQRREKVEYLLDFNPETAAGMMDLDYVTVDRSATLREVAERVRRHDQRTGRFPTIYVTDEQEGLVGELPGHTLGLANGDEKGIEEQIREAPSVRFDEPDEQVVEVFRKHPNRRLAVLDEEGEILGVIHADDLLRAVDEQAGETLYEFTGVAEEESVLDGPMAKVASRYKWLILNLGTSFLAAAVVGMFADTIDLFPLLAVYMPIVAGMGGNAGTQTMAVTVRGLTLDQVSLETGARVMGNEVLAGAVNGLLNGLLVAAIATFFNQNPALGLVIGVAMIGNLVIAGFFGALIPLILDKLEFDPATSATIFITTATDVLGFFVFLGLASLVM